MRGDERINVGAIAVSAVVGTAIGLLLQFGFNARGAPTLVPPLSLPASLLTVAAVLIVFGVRLRRNAVNRPGAVNPFHAVRLLATARAGQVVGALLGGTGAGLALVLLGRSVAPPVSTWLPMVLTAVAGALLVVCAVIAERLCRVPPGDGEKSEDQEPDRSPGPSDQPAYRKP